MNPYVKTYLKTLVNINLVLISTGFVGMYASIVLALSKPFFGIVLCLSIWAGIINAWYLHRNFKSKTAWQYNFYLSVWAIILWTIIFIISEISFWQTGYWVLFIWPIKMLVGSTIVLYKSNKVEKELEVVT